MTALLVSVLAFPVPLSVQSVPAGPAFTMDRNMDPYGGPKPPREFSTNSRSTSPTPVRAPFNAKAAPVGFHSDLQAQFPLCKWQFKVILFHVLDRRPQACICSG